MTNRDLALTAGALILYATLSRRLRGTPITSAIVFVTLGFVVGTQGLDLFQAQIGSTAVRHLAEVTLTLVLFSDASAINSRALVREAALPARLLGIGLPLTIVLGCVIAVVAFPQLGFFPAMALAVLLAPTDAALGQTVVSDERLPSPLRQGLNVESGLNDGICVPLLFATIAFTELEGAAHFNGRIIIDLVKEVAIASGIGVGTAAIVVAVYSASDRRGWIDDAWASIVPLAAAALAYGLTATLGGSGFIAAFVAGLSYGRLLGDRTPDTMHFLEDAGQGFSAVTFFVFGAVVVGGAVDHLDWATMGYAVASLTVVRMLPVAVAMIGRGAALPTMAFAGWFGPRGLASIVFMLTIVDESGMPGTQLIVRVTTVTVLLSVFAHGITAPWLTNRYVAWYSRSNGLDLEARRAV